MAGEAFEERLEGALPQWRDLSDRSTAEQAHGNPLGPATQAMMALAESLEDDLTAFLGGPLDQSLHMFHGTSSLALAPGRLCWAVLDVASESGPPDATLWLKKVLATRSAPGRVVVSVTGIMVDREAMLLPGVGIRPAGPDRNAGRMSFLLTGRHAFEVKPGAEAFLEVADLPFIGPVTDISCFDRVAAAQAKLEELITALAVAGGAPRVSELWVEFSDPDLRRVSRDGPSMYTLREHHRFLKPLIDLDLAAKLLNGYEQLHGDHRRAMSVALDRLVSSQIERFNGDKVLDGAIALEALLLDESGEELSYRLRLRAALFLETELDDRRRIFRSIRDFYTIRSKVAHGRVAARDAGGGSSAEVVSAGLEIVQRVARKICERGAFPDWRELELGGQSAPALQ